MNFPDPVEMQRLRNSIAEGETLLRGHKKRNDPAWRGMTQRAVDNSKAKLAALLAPYTEAN